MNEIKREIRFGVVLLILSMVGILLSRFITIEINKGKEITYLNDTSLSFFFIFVMIFLIPFLFFLIFRENKIFDKNLAKITQLLNAYIERPFFGLWFYQVVKGVYKNREITCIISFLSIELCHSDFFIKPNIVVEIKPNYFKVIRITDKTRLWENKIKYEPKPFDFEAERTINLIYKVHSDNNFMDIFEELTRAAEIFENNPYKYVPTK